MCEKMMGDLLKELDCEMLLLLTTGFFLSSTTFLRLL